MHTLAVVPIFMSAGAAVLPTVIAAVTSVAAVIFKPRELARQFRLRPKMMSGITLSLLAACILVGWWMATPAKAAPRAAIHPQQTDWAQVARDILAQEKLHAASTPATTGTASAPAHLPPSDTQTPNPASDFARTMFSGTIAPTHLTQVWNYHPEFATFLSNSVFSPDNKRIYVAGCIGGADAHLGLLACLDADTGKPLWEKADIDGDTMKPFFSSPALTADGKYLVIGQGLHQDRNCSLLCFDTANGDLKWHVPTTIHIESSPAIMGDMAVVGAGAIEGSNGMATGDPGFVFAVRISDGKKLWQQAVNDPESSPVIDSDGTVFIGSGFNGNAVYALRSQSDEELKTRGQSRILWRTPSQFPVTGPLTLFGDLVIAGGGNSDMAYSAANAKGQVMALHRKTGEIAWSVTTDDSILGSMPASGGMVVCPSRTGDLLALSAADGSLLWQRQINGRVPIVAGVALGAGKAYALSTDGTLGIVDAAHGAVLEKIYVNEIGPASSGLSMSTPRVVNGRLIVASETGGVRMYIGDK